MKMMDTGISAIASICRKLVSGVGFSSATVLFGPYQPPPLLPSCLIATIGATGPSGIFCSWNSAVASTGLATGPAASVAGTPCHVSSSDSTRHSGSTKRSVARTTSAQKLPTSIASASPSGRCAVCTWRPPNRPRKVATTTARPITGVTTCRPTMPVICDR